MNRRLFLFEIFFEVVSAAKSSKKGSAKERFSEVRNNKAHRNYFVEEKLEVGIQLRGTEIKAVREGKAQINDCFARIDKGELFLYHAHIGEYSFGTDQNHAPLRPRKLLAHRKEILRLKNLVEAGGLTLVPLRMYFKGSLLKVELGVCKGKKLFDKREDLKRKTDMREAQRAMKFHR